MLAKDFYIKKLVLKIHVTKQHRLIRYCILLVYYIYIKNAEFSCLNLIFFLVNTKF